MTGPQMGRGAQRSSPAGNFDLRVTGISARGESRGFGVWSGSVEETG